MKREFTMFHKNGRTTLFEFDLRQRAWFLSTRACCLLLFLAIMAPGLWAATGGSISGTVTDPKSLAVSGAKVTVLELNTNLRQTTTTDSKGFYSLT